MRAAHNNRMQLTRPAPRQLGGAVLAADPGVVRTRGDERDGMRRQGRVTYPAIAALAGLASSCSGRVGVEGRPDAQVPLSSELPTPAPFTFASTLECEVVLHTYGPGQQGRRFLVHGVGDATAMLGSSSTPKAMTRLHESAQRVVYQATGEDPGSVDTLSIDKGTGAYARLWSGWGTGQAVLHAGGERGYCRPTTK
jgi:hypothetical protein